MPQQLITARLKPGITGLTLYAGQENFIELKDLIEVRDVNSLIITQPTIGGVTANIEHVIGYDATLPSGWVWGGFIFNSVWYFERENTLTNHKTTIKTNSSSGSTGTIILKVSVGLLNKDGFSFNVNLPYGVHELLKTTYISLPYEVVAAPTTSAQVVAPSAYVPVINFNNYTATTTAGEIVFSTVMQQSKESNAQILATNSPTSFTAINLPPGLTINNSGLISGTPTDIGVFLTSITASNDAGTSTRKTLRIDVEAASTTPAFLETDGVDIFFDLQSRALTLTPPKEETAIPSDTKVINSLVADRLMVKTGETLWLNVRFVKGTTPLDPVATGLRFGVAGKLGGPLLMEGDTFTKVGEGSSAYYRMRVTPIENEFSAIIDDYYDDDAVEQISAANENQPSSSGEVEGLCEVALTTGTGETIAEIKSDTLGVVLKRSIF
jgi:hypothetical protein